MAQPNINDTQVAKVAQFVKDTTTTIMATTTSTVPDADAPGAEEVPLHFLREVVIQHQHYILELQKEQGSLWLKELSVRWVPERDAKPPGDVFCTIVTSNVEENLVEYGSGGFYQVVCEASEDFEYFVRLHVARL